MNSQKLHPRMLVGLFFIFLGILFLLDNYYNFGIDILGDIINWKNILIAAGTVILVAKSHKTPGFVLIGIGLWGYFPDFWPLLLILLGISIILRNKPPKDDDDKSFFHFNSNPEKVDKNKIDDASIFGGGTKVVISDAFTGGKITSIFGGSEIDLTQCKLAPGDNYLDILAVFGGSTLIIPPDWKVVVDVLPIFGGFSDDRKKYANMVQPDDRILYVKGIVIFGGGELKSY